MYTHNKQPGSGAIWQTHSTSIINLPTRTKRKTTRPLIDQGLGLATPHRWEGDRKPSLALRPGVTSPRMFSLCSSWRRSLPTHSLINTERGDNYLQPLCPRQDFLSPVRWQQRPPWRAKVFPWLFSGHLKSSASDKHPPEASTQGSFNYLKIPLRNHEHADSFSLD